MNHIKKSISLYTILSCVIFFASTLLPQEQKTITFISPRSQSFNAERMLAGWENVIHQSSKKNESYAVLGFTLEATSSFRPERINQCLFGEDIIQCKAHNTEWPDFIIISGSQTENRIPNKDWLADYFGLPTDFKSLIRFRPRVNNIIFDLHSYLNLGTILPGLYARIELPLVYANWDLNMKECIQQAGKNSYSPGYFNATGVERDQLMPSFSEFISGGTSPHADNLIFHPLRYAKMYPCSRRLVRCAELTTTIGYDYFIGTYNHIGCAFQVAAPLGNRPRGEFLFESIIGNGHHWECGMEFSSRCRTWTDITEETFTEFFCNITATHLFPARQKRSFDLNESSNSRYMLAQKFTNTITDNLTGNGISAAAQYAQEVTPIANISTFNCDVSINAQTDIAFMYAYTHKRNTWTIGYSLWKRGCEQICINKKDFIGDNTWTIKGDAYVFGFIGEQTQPNDMPIETAVPLSATEKNSSVNSGTNGPATGISSENERIIAMRNPHIDNAQKAFGGNNQRLVASKDDLSPANQINTSIQPSFISMANIDIKSAASSGFAQKIFTHLNHKITTPSDQYSLNIGIGSEIEFGRQAGPTPAIGADKYVNCALSYWGSWIKMTVIF